MLQFPDYVASFAVQITLAEKMYRPPSVRNFKIFIGELTAEAAACYVSMSESRGVESMEANYWTSSAHKLGIKLEGVKSDKVAKSQIRLSIVSIYSGFDLFAEMIKSECKEFGITWQTIDKASPLAIFENNFTKVPNNKARLSQIFDVVNYYRILRNSIAHPSEENKSKAIQFYKSKADSINGVRSEYSMLSAPNAPDDISFHDIKFLCRLLIDVTEEIGSLLEPEEAMIYKAVPLASWAKYGNDHEKLKKSAISYIHSTYSYPRVKSEEIVNKHYGTLA